MITSNLIINLFLILTVAWMLGILFSRMGLPAMLGELMAGVILGPPLLGIVSASAPIELLAELGIFFVMFHTGMELNPKELLNNIWPSLSVAVGGFVLPFALGFGVAYAFGGTVYQSLFVAIGVSITAIAVQSVILYSLKINQTGVGHVILGAAIVDDILSLMALSVLLAMVKTGSIQFTVLLLIVVKVAAFFGLTIVVGHFIAPRFTWKLTTKGETAFTFALAAAFLMAYLAHLAGLHLIIGAFLAGQFVRKEIVDDNVFHMIGARFTGISYGFLVPIFFASLAFHLHLRFDWMFLYFALALILTATLGKLVGCGLGAALFKYNFWESTVVGLGMNGRGAVELVIAAVILNLSDELMAAQRITEPLLTSDQFSALVLMAFATTIIAPISLKWAVTKTCLPNEKASFCTLWDEAKGG